jgi:hypothetical protein
MARSLAQVQVDRDRARLGTDATLLRRKWRRMAASPFAFLRGASPLFGEALRRAPGLLRGYPGEGPLVGDLHLENFGTFLGARGFTFHVNDFDETFVGPFAFDVLRLLCSTVLARPELGVTGVGALRLAGAVLEGHAAGLEGGRVPAPPSVQALVAAGDQRKEKAWVQAHLDARGKLALTEKTPPASPASRRLAVGAVATWAGATAAGAVRVLDVCRRVAGTGSLGVQRLLALVAREDGGGQRLVELKEVRGTRYTRGHASAVALVHTLQRVLPLPPVEVAAARLGPLPVVARVLRAGEDKIAAEAFPREELEALCRYLGFLLGTVHRRGSSRAVRWSPRLHARLVAGASQLAGLHEQAFVEFCTLVQPTIPEAPSRRAARTG